MNHIFLTKIEINQIRHLNQINIQLSDSIRKQAKKGQKWGSNIKRC